MFCAVKKTFYSIVFILSLAFFSRSFAVSPEILSALESINASCSAAYELAIKSKAPEGCSFSDYGSLFVFTGTLTVAGVGLITILLKYKKLGLEEQAKLNLEKAKLALEENKQLLELRKIWEKNALEIITLIEKLKSTPFQDLLLKDYFFRSFSMSERAIEIIIFNGLENSLEFVGSKSDNSDARFIGDLAHFNKTIEPSASSLTLFDLSLKAEDETKLMLIFSIKSTEAAIDSDYLRNSEYLVLTIWYQHEGENAFSIQSIQLDGKIVEAYFSDDGNKKDACKSFTKHNVINSYGETSILSIDSSIEQKPYSRLWCKIMPPVKPILSSTPIALVGDGLR